jgi:hypothetical protein
VETIRVDAASDVIAVLATDSDPITLTHVSNGDDVVVTGPGLLMLTAIAEATASVTAL